MRRFLEEFQTELSRLKIFLGLPQFLVECNIVSHFLFKLTFRDSNLDTLYVGTWKLAWAFENFSIRQLACDFFYGILN